jgi:hypothetical protein
MSLTCRTKRHELGVRVQVEREETFEAGEDKS